MNPKELSGAVVSPLGDLIIPVEHFGLCPVSDLTRDGFCTSQWTLSRGGKPVPDRTWTLDIFQQDENGETTIKLDRWIMPEAFAVLFDHFEKSADSERIRKIKNALGLT